MVEIEQEILENVENDPTWSIGFMTTQEEVDHSKEWKTL